MNTGLDLSPSISKASSIAIVIMDWTCFTVKEKNDMTIIRWMDWIRFDPIKQSSSTAMMVLVWTYFTINEASATEC